MPDNKSVDAIYKKQIGKLAARLLFHALADFVYNRQEIEGIVTEDYR
ncbi:MAG TPA: hypothetical protein PKZ34_04650 [Thermotogota bacterium]|nr:hypothetical protein [Thermotogota bacterium]HOD92157.1 hypothetical protein [Thermotogota bacterium]HPE42355.1 hypothetical protein [Thermotogota bacterium]HPV95337.1 hypothetical protein [Thermotogota bacterium]HQC37331.1 hypothetical protein [Thermotogota bacterium]